MSAAESSTTSTALRSFELRTRELPLDAQMVECIDLLQSPKFVVEDLVRSVAQIQSAGASRATIELVMDEGVSRDPRTSTFYPSRELFVQGDACSFTCLATGLAFRDSAQPDASRDDVERRPFDYAAVTCEARPFPVLGFMQSVESESAYPLLLRALSGLIELAAPHRFDLLDRDVFRGLLGPAPVFDLALVLWDDEPDARRPLCELSRDLAEVLKRALAAEPRFPPVLNDIVCLRMNQKRFDGRLRYVWRV